MNSKRIIELINKPGNISTEESAELKNLSAEYPYCQALHLLKAKEARDKHLPDEKEKLVIAALYTSDRSILQKYLTKRPQVEEKKSSINKDLPKPELKSPQKTDKAPSPEVKSPVKPKDTTAPDKKISPGKKSDPQPKIKSAIVKKETAEAQKPLIPVKKSPDKTSKQPDNKSITQEPIKQEKSRDLADELINNLDKYKKIRDEYISLEEKLEGKTDQNKKTTPSKVDKSTSSNVKKDSSTKDAKTGSDTNDANKNKKSVEPENKVVDADQAPESAENKDLSLKAEAPQIEVPTEAPEKEDVIIEVENPQLIKDHIKRLDRKAAENFRKLKQQEQLALIDRFIETTPDLTVSKSKSGKVKDDQEDLSFSSTQFGDDLVTENLANIMILQKNLETAIDIYKKLIWKFPQKKGYFASQIEKLEEQIKKGS